MAHLDIRPANIFIAPSSACPPLVPSPCTSMSPPSSMGSHDRHPSPKDTTNASITTNTTAETAHTPSSDAGFSFGQLPSSTTSKNALGRSLSFREMSLFHGSSSYLCESQQSQELPPVPPPPLPPLDDTYVRRKRSFATAIPDTNATSTCTMSRCTEIGCDDNIGLEDICKHIASGAWEVKVGDLGEC